METKKANVKSVKTTEVENVKNVRCIKNLSLLPKGNTEFEGLNWLKALKLGQSGTAKVIGFIGIKSKKLTFGGTTPNVLTDEEQIGIYSNLKGVDDKGALKPLYYYLPTLEINIDGQDSVVINTFVLKDGKIQNINDLADEFNFKVIESDKSTKDNQLLQFVIVK